MYDLKALGWNEFFDREFQSYRELGHFAGRVVLEQRGAYRLYAESGELIAQVRGKLRFDSTSAADFPAVGDWVSVATRERDGLAQIHAVLPRRSKFSRKAAGSNSEEQVVAANVDTVFIVQGHGCVPRFFGRGQIDSDKQNRWRGSSKDRRGSRA